MFFPFNEGPRSTIDSLRNEQCGFTLAAKKKKTHIIQDIKEFGKKKKGFIITDESRADESGSILCYPVVLRNTNEIPYVISLSVDKKHFFDKHIRKECEFVLEKMKNRILVEHCLSIIKGVGQ